MSRVITLLTDFGTADGYVGEVKGILASSAPDCSMIDIAHDLPPQDVEAIELYPGPSTTPPQFANRINANTCGAIVIWTRIPGA